ncbi:MAG: DUF1996 domain-containing protein [Actinomycetota bacterium]
MDDPIVYPNQPAASHPHDFFGSRDTNASSTPASLVASSGTTCTFPSDRSGYWIPQLMLSGQPVVPTSVSVYYRGPDWGYDSSQVQPLPPGLKVIAGNAGATSKQPYTVTYWQCGPGSRIPKSPTPYDCSRYPDTRLRAHLVFPSCWDGVSLDSSDHRRHMTYPVTKGAAACPSSHPVLVARITAVVTYPIVDGSGATLSSGSSYSFHADFMNGWDQPTLIRLVDDCINAGVYCRF